ncbi:hypothetical protein A9Q99_06895 [Gammaproteobacteria bacterium 45_16_T64]|nr:hypothetical protein A9Q99_06895 [Gammaproteobacteria bacterium 45_16_T64]
MVLCKSKDLPRRKPSQHRGKEKVEIILESAKSLIGDRGNDAVSMREIAAHAGISPSSIYQYFPDKNAILSALINEYFEQIHHMITTLIESVSNLDSIGEHIANGMDQFIEIFRKEPALATIWAGVQANPVLRNLDAEDSAKNAALLTEALTHLAPGINKAEAFNANLLLMHTASTTARLALNVGKSEGDALLSELRTLTKLRIEALLQNSI